MQPLMLISGRLFKIIWITRVDLVLSDFQGKGRRLESVLVEADTDQRMSTLR